MQMKRIILFLGTCLLLSGGCVFLQNSYVEPEDYDLAPAKRIPDGKSSLQFGVLRNFSGADRRIMVRQEDGTVRRDEYRRWVQDPELLIQRFFYESLPGGGTSLPVVRVSGSLYRFEFVKKPAAASFLAGFQLEYKGEKQELRCEYSIPVNDTTTPIAAINECLFRASSELRKTADEMVTKEVRK